MRISTLIVVLLTLQSYAQEKDTIYYNRYWKKTTKQNAQFYRPLPLQKKGNLYLVKDYYSNGKLQMEGYSSSTSQDIFEGKVVWYYATGQIQSEREYSNGIPKKNTSTSKNTNDVIDTTADNGVLVKRSTKNKYTGNTLTCTYKEGKPHTGKEMKYSNEIAYDDGCKISEISYDDITGLPVTKTFYHPGQYGDEVSKKFFFKDGHTYKLYYLDGIPYKGTELNSFGIITYDKGEYNGPYELWGNNYLETGTYKNFKKEGHVTFVLNSKTYVCNFKGDKPHTGTAVNDLNGEIISYKDYKRHGTYIKTTKNITQYDSIVGQYSNDVPTGNFGIYKQGVKVAHSVYKNGMPHDGIFYDNKNYEQYHNGILEASYDVASFDKYTVQKNYANGIIVEEFVTDLATNSTYQLRYKKGKPFDGQQFLKHDDAYTLTPYKKGKKQGKQLTYQYAFKTLEKELYFKNNVISDTSTFYFKNNRYTCTYKKGKPVNGVVIDRDSKLIRKLTYTSEGLERIVYFKTYGNTPITTMHYKNGQPYDGYLLTQHGKDTNAAYYIKGKHVKTYINYHGSDFKTGITSNKEVYHTPLKDSIVSKQYSSASISITYADATKQSGTIRFFDKTPVVSGSAGFKNNTLTQFEFTKRNTKTSYQEAIQLVDDTLVYSITVNTFKAQFEVPNPPITVSVYHYITDIINPKPKNTTITMYHEGKPICNLKMNDGKRYEGILFMPNKNDVYRVDMYQKGKRIHHYLDLTKAEALAKVETLKHSL